MHLDKQWYHCPIDLIAHNITTVLSIVAWYLIKDHQLLYIDRKYFSYLSLFIEVFSRNLFLTKSEHLLFINTFQSQHIKWSKIIFLSPFSRLQGRTNPTSVMGAKQWVKALLLLKLFEPFVFDNTRTT